ncbi:MAG: 4Fe-4S binding protein [Actinobacteria bacterium]|nr:4Fe-4S binding protein [Actinomycetota bacterium]
MRTGRRRAVHWTRRTVQALFLALFVLAAWAASYPPAGTMSENLFLRVDPLAAFVAARASSLWLYLLPAWILLGLTVFSGRFFCGWICPLGSFLEMLPSLERRRAASLARLRPRDLSGKPIGEGNLRLRIKYPFLTALLILFLLGVNALWIFDPLVIANRAVVFVLAGGVPIVFIALAVLAVVAGPRFWCQEMCPLGACLSAASMAGSRLPAKASPLALVKDEEACIHCGRCSLVCPFGIVEVADSAKTGRVAIADCALCGECVAACPVEGALSLCSFGAPLQRSGKKRRSRSRGTGIPTQGADHAGDGHDREEETRGAQERRERTMAPVSRRSPLSRTSRRPGTEPKASGNPVSGEDEDTSAPHTARVSGRGGAP